MAPLLWKASWRRGKNIVIPSYYSGVDVGSGSERHGRSQGEHANPSSDGIVSSTTLITSTTRRASDDVHSSMPISSLPPTSTSPPSTTDTRSLSTIPSETLSFPSPRPHLVSEPAITTSSPEPTTTRVATSSPLSSSLPPTQKTEPSINLDVVLSSSSNAEDVAPTLTPSNNISSSTFSSKIPATDIPRSTTTPLSGNSLQPTKCQFDASGRSLPNETNMPFATGTLRYLPPSTSACSLFTQDYNTKVHNGIPPNTPSPQPSLSLDEPLGIPGHSSISNTITTTRPNPSLTPSSPLSSTLTGQTLTSAPPLTNGGKGFSDKPVRTTTSLSSGLLVVSTPPGSKTTSVTTSLLSATSVISSSVLKTKTTDSIVVTDHPTGVVHTLIPSGLPQKNGKSKAEPSQPGSSVSLLDSTSVSGGSTASSPSLSTTSLITSTTATPIPSLTSVDSVRLAPFSNLNQLGVVDDAPGTTDLSTPTVSSQDVTASFTTNTVVVTFSPIQISGKSTSIPVTQTVQTVLPTVFPVIPATGDKKSVPIAAIVAPVSAVVVLILLLIGFMFHRNRQRVHRASQPTFDFSPSTPAPAMSDTEPAQRPPFKEVTVLPIIPAMSGGWGEAFALTQGADDPFADPVSIPPSATRLPDESPRAPLVLPPALTLDPFVDPPALVSTPPDDDGPNRLSKGSSYDESIARASISSSHVGCAM